MGGVGGIVWNAWSFFVYHNITGDRYVAAQNAKIGFLAGFLAGFPDNFAQATWFVGGRALPFGWMVEMWLGAILAALVAGFLYKE